MEQMPSLPVSQAEAIRENARKSAIFTGGHKFIWLSLLNQRRSRITGIEYVHATPYIDERGGGMTRFYLEVRGGTMDFQYDPNTGIFRYAMLDSEHNRKFLASHYHHEFWKIEDEKIDAEIKKMSEAIAEKIKKTNDEAPEEKSTEKPKKAGRPKKVEVPPVMAISPLIEPKTRVVSP